MQKNTLLLGCSSMSGANCVHEMAELGDLQQAMAHSLSTGLKEEMYDNFIKHIDYLLSHYLYSLNDDFTEYFFKDKISLAEDMYRLVK